MKKSFSPTGGKYTDEPAETLLAPVTLQHRDEDFSSNLLAPHLRKDCWFLLATELYVVDMLI